MRKVLAVCLSAALTLTSVVPVFAEMFSGFGKELLQRLGIEDEYEGIGHCALGYAAAPAAAPAPRKENYVYYL